MDSALRILILEDVAEDAELICRELHKGGIFFTAKRADSRESFLRELGSFAPEVILADYRLPSFDGVSALRIAREDRPEVPFIFVTGAMGEEWAIETLKKGATDYILKDSLTRLAPAVRRALKEVEERNGLRRAEEALRKTTEQLKNIFDNIDVMLFSLDYHDNRVLQVSPACEKIYGVTQAAFSERMDLWKELIHAEDSLRVEARMYHLRAGKPVEVEYRVARPDGEIRWVRGKLNPTMDASGHLARVDGFLNDITERKHAEDALRENEEQFKSLAASARDAIIVVGEDGRISYWNEAAEKMFCCPCREALGRELHTFLIPGRYSEAYLRAFSVFRETGGMPEIENTFEAMLLKKGGEEFPAEVSTSAVRMKKGWQIIGIVRDITERREVEEAMRRRMEDLESFRTAAVRNEERMREMKERIRDLERQLESAGH